MVRQGVVVVTMPAMLRLRPARVEDVDAIVELIRELAAFERAPEAARATAADLVRDGFGAVPRFQVTMAEWDGQRAGFALYFYNYSTWEGRPGLYLEDLFVREAFRGRGIGRALLAHLAQVAVSGGCRRFQWQVLDWNQPALDFYHRLGARLGREWLPMRVEGEALQRLAAQAVEAQQ